MNSASSPIAELLMECEAQGIELQLADSDGLTIDAPHGALSAYLLDRLKAYKRELLGVLRAPQQGIPNNYEHQKAFEVEVVCRCGSTTWRDVPIHEGLSVRRDCAGCRRFIGFPLWYGQACLQNVK